jgi:hypothetical protein
MFGVWEEGSFRGVVVFSRGANNRIGSPYNLEQDEVCELTRVAMRTHDAPVSQCCSYAMKMMKRDNPGIRLIVSYADPYEDHHGGIYQAMNWVYTGTTPKDRRYIDSKGRRLHSRQVSTKGYEMQFGKKTRVPKPSECEVVMVPGKHKYLYPLDRAMRRQIEPLAKPYPDPID